MKIRLNGESTELGASLNVAALVAQVTRRPDTRGVAVAINGNVVPRGEWGKQLVCEGDEIEVLQATAGG
jgi:sulfur carrier protein